jgi:hypothetical protein
MLARTRKRHLTVATLAPFDTAGIKKPKDQRYRSSRGVDPKFLRNARQALKGLMAAKAKKATKA